MTEIIGKAKHAVIDRNIFGCRIVSGIVTGVRFTEDKPLYCISMGRDSWWTEYIFDNLHDLVDSLDIVSLDRVMETHGLKIKYER